MMKDIAGLCIFSLMLISLFFVPSDYTQICENFKRKDSGLMDETYFLRDVICFPENKEESIKLDLDIDDIQYMQVKINPVRNEIITGYLTLLKIAMMFFAMGNIITFYGNIAKNEIFTKWGRRIADGSIGGIFVLAFMLMYSMREFLRVM